MSASVELGSKSVIEVKGKPSEKYTLTNLILARQLLRTEFHRNDHSIRFSRKAFITTIDRQFHIQDARVAATPMDTNVELDLDDNSCDKEINPESVKDYQAIVGSLMYAALSTQPDISYAVAALCRYNCP